MARLQRLIAPISFVAACLLVVASGTAALAAAGEWQKTDIVAARLVSAVEGTGTLAQIPLGLELKLKDNWKTYWRSPGDAGLPPALNWQGSQNLASATLAYPAPHRFTLLNSQTFGYKQHVVYPIMATVAGPGGALTLKARLDVLVCAEICVPQTFDLAMTIPQGAALPGPEAQLVNRFQSLVPQEDAQGALAISTVTAAQNGAQQTLQVSVAASEPFKSPDIFVEVQPEANFGAPEVVLSDNGHRALISLPLARPLPAGATLVGRPVTLTLVDGVRAIEHKMIIAQGAAESGFSRLPMQILMFGFALLGGVILNLMPCVLPVLSLKLMSLVRQGGAPPAHVRANFLATAAGIVVSLLLLAAGLIGLRSAGLAVGWGIQFQQPVFIAVVAVIVALFACNLWGFFEIALPHRLTSFVGTAGGDGGGLVSNFVIGAFATLLATPCSAPFVGTAVGFALAGGTGQILLIFLALGLGLAVPYLAVAAFPSVARFIPKPGLWMVRLRQALGFALAGTTIWLLTILPAEAGLAATLAVSAQIATLVVVLAGLSRLQDPSRNASRGGAAAALAIIAAAGLTLMFGARTAGQDKPDTINWVHFDRDQIKSLVAQGKTVFVDVTADWCVVCQSNKNLVTNTQAVSQRINSATIAMKADWTSPDAKIAAFLSSFGRYGIPLNVVYGPGAPAGILLPELLTRDAVFSAIDRAGRQTAAQAPG